MSRAERDSQLQRIPKKKLEIHGLGLRSKRAWIPKRKGFMRKNPNYMVRLAALGVLSSWDFVVTSRSMPIFDKGNEQRIGSMVDFLQSALLRRF